MKNPSKILRLNPADLSISSADKSGIFYLLAGAWQALRGMVHKAVCASVWQYKPMKGLLKKLR
ncbi:MAG: hypothetical protein KBA53_07010 [Thermoclostridium sp.]|nr:hypothetical protein [Thermoclostridium sp.]